PTSQLAMDSAGDVFGTALMSDQFTGNIWRYTAGSGTITSLASFTGGVNSVTAVGPLGVVLNPTTGDLYGAVANQVFKIPSAGGALQFAASFKDSSVFSPSGPVAIDANGNIFGEGIGVVAGSSQPSSDIWEFSDGVLKEIAI